MKFRLLSSFPHQKISDTVKRIKVKDEKIMKTKTYAQTYQKKVQDREPSFSFFSFALLEYTHQANIFYHDDDAI